MKKNLVKWLGVSVGFITTSILLGVSLSNAQGINFKSVYGEDDLYCLVLDDKNSVGLDGTYEKVSRTGGKVNFKYDGVSQSNGNHTALAANGTIVNTDIIHSLTSFQADFSGSLKARVAYTTENWGDYFDLLSGQKISLGSNPYYIELKATTNVVLESAIYGYSCLVNPNAESYDTTGDYTITFKANGSDSSSAISTSNEIKDQVTTGENYISSASGSNVFAGEEGLKFSSSKKNGSLTLNINSSTVKESISSIDFDVAQYASENGILSVYLNDSSNVAASINASSGSGSISVNNKVTKIEIDASKRCYLEGITLNYGSTHIPGKPIEEVGFTAEDTNKTKYTTHSIFDNDNGLSVSALYSDGSKTSLAKGGDNGYSYKVFDSNDTQINTNEAFPHEGSYKIVVYYKNYIQIEIPFVVGEYVYIEDILPEMEDTTFTTAETLSENLSNNLTAVVIYSNGGSDTINYDSFNSLGLGVNLLTPKGFNYDQTLPFGNEGQWTVKVYRLDDESISGTIKINVNAIPVESISLNETTKQMYPNDTLQLVPTVGPNSATNQSVYWTSNNEEVAIVDENGLVTAISIGGATITATAADGSGVIATCSITVVAKPATPYSIVFSNESSDSGTAMSTSNWSNYVTSGEEYVSSVSGLTRVYPGTKGYKLGSGSGGGSITFNFSNEVSDSITSIDIETVKYNNNDSQDMSAYVNGGTAHEFTSSEGATILVGDHITTLRITSSARAYLSSITLNRGGSSSTPIYPTSITITGNNSISVGETSQLTIGYTPSDVNVKNVTYSSNDESVAAVSANGLVTGVSVGDATITASAEGANSTAITSTINFTVNKISVTSVSLNQQSASVKAGKTVILTPTIYPNNATNKNVTWSTSNSGVATVNNGVVSGVAAGEATITVTTVDGNKTASCVVSVSAGSSSSEWELVSSASSLSAGDVLVLASYTNNCTNGDISSQILGTVASSFSSDHTTITSLGEDTIQLTLGGKEGAWTFANDDGDLLGATAAKKLAWNSGTTTWSISISGGDASITNTNDSFGTILYNSSSPRFTTYTSSPSSSMLLPQLYRGGVAEPVDPTSILLSKTSLEMSPGASKTLDVSYIPSNANQNKDVTWTSSNENVVTVSNGTITAKNSATTGQSAVITAKLTNLPTITATCTIEIVESQKADHTVMIYMCGADLESGTDSNGNVPSASNATGLASSDIDEILKVTGQPDDVNIIIETGGSNIWQSGHSYSISNSKLERWHIENRSLVKDDSLTYASMGLTSTFQSFLQWGLNSYPAERTGVVLWNHGGGMHGVCYDEKKNDDSLLNSEVSAALQGAFNSVGRSTSNKLEWIGYDACLMAVQDIAEFNSKYFNYQISSEESEAGYGWDYDNWVDNLYKKQSTTTILKEICDTFIADNGGVNKSSGDQTLSYLTLSYMSAYKVAWESMTEQLAEKLTSNNKSSFNSAIVNKVKHFADDDYDYFCLFDAKDFINKLANDSSFSSFRINSSYTSAVTTAFGNLVSYSTVQKGAGNAYGLCMYWTNSSQYSYISTYYTTSQTSFMKWQSLCNTYGTHR